MISEKLKQTDERLLELLRDRLLLLADSGLPTLEEQFAAVAPLVAQLGVPEAVWANVVMSCFNAIAVKPAPAAVDPVKPQQIAIIGGGGRMGKFFTQRLSAVGHHVSILGREDWEQAERLLAEAELVIVSVPIEQTVEIVKRTAKYLAPTTALTDITSIKVQPVQAMLQHHGGPVMGLHPMFGPSVKSFLGQTVVVCPGRNDASFQWFLDFMASQGAKLVYSTPAEHDQMMVLIQAMRHFSRFSFGVFLAAAGIDVGRSLLMSSPNYRLEIDIVNRLFTQNPTLCVDIMLATEERCQAIEQLANTYSRLAQLVAQKDRSTLIQEFETAQSFFRDCQIHAPQESDRAIAAPSNQSAPLSSG